MTRPLRWGVLGASSRNYHTRLVPAFGESTRNEVVATASRADGPGDAPYAELVARPDVDAVYIPLPNHLHATWIERALGAGKHVLCEKPLTMNAADTSAMFAAAQAAGRVLTEAYVWPHHPRSKLIRELAAGSLGEIRHLRSSFAFVQSRADDHRLDERGDGALLDIGIYCIAPAMLIADREPAGVAASGVLNAAGVDLTTTGHIDWGQGFTSAFEVSFEAPDRRTLDLSGTEGYLTLDPHADMPGTPGWHTPGPESASSVSVLRRDGTTDRHDVPGANAFTRMIDQFAAVLAGEEAPVFGPEASMRLARVLDAVRSCARRPSSTRP